MLVKLVVFLKIIINLIYLKPGIVIFLEMLLILVKLVIFVKIYIVIIISEVNYILSDNVNIIRNACKFTCTILEMLKTLFMLRKVDKSVRS